MHFVIEAKDKLGALSIRQKTRPDHLAYLESLGEALCLAGPFVDADGDANGSLVIVSAPDLDAAQKIADADPYLAAGLFETVSVRPWVWALKAPQKED